MMSETFYNYSRRSDNVILTQINIIRNNRFDVRYAKLVRQQLEEIQTGPLEHLEENIHELIRLDHVLMYKVPYELDTFPVIFLNPSSSSFTRRKNISDCIISLGVIDDGSLLSKKKLAISYPSESFYGLYKPAVLDEVRHFNTFKRMSLNKDILDPVNNSLVTISKQHEVRDLLCKTLLYAEKKDIPLAMQKIRCMQNTLESELNP